MQPVSRTTVVATATSKISGRLSTPVGVIGIATLAVVLLILWTELSTETSAFELGSSLSWAPSWCDSRAQNSSSVCESRVTSLENEIRVIRSAVSETPRFASPSAAAATPAQLPTESSLHKSMVYRMFASAPNSPPLIVSKEPQEWFGRDARATSRVGLNEITSFVVRDAPALGHAARDLTILWSILHFQLMAIDQIVFAHGEAKRNFSSSDRLGRIHTDYLLPLTEVIVAGTSPAGAPSVGPKIVCADELKDGMLLGRVVNLRGYSDQPFASVPWFGGLDGGGLRDALYSRYEHSTPASPPMVLTFIRRKHARVVTNNAAVEEWLKGWCARKGLRFNPLELGDDHGGVATLKDQVHAFADTGILVAMHGAACFNAIMLPRNSVVVELVPTSLRWNLFRTLSHSVGVQHVQHYVSAPDCTGGPFNQCDATVDIAPFELTMDDAFERLYSFVVADRLFEHPHRQGGGCG